MTDDRIFKDKVKKIAEANSLSYTEAKKIAIKATEMYSLEVVEKRENEAIHNYRTMGASPYVNLSTPLFEEEPIAKKSMQLDNEDYIQLDNVRNNFIDVKHLRLAKDFVNYSNVKKGRIFISNKSEYVRKTFSHFVENYFGRKDSFFIDEENFLSQSNKILNFLENKDINSPILIGIISPEINSNDESKEEIFKNICRRINQLMFNKNIYFILNKRFPMNKREMDEINLIMDVINIDDSYIKSPIKSLIKQVIKMLNSDNSKKISNIDRNGDIYDQLKYVFSSDNNLLELLSVCESRIAIMIHPIKESAEILKKLFNDNKFLSNLRKKIKNNNNKIFTVEFSKPHNNINIKYYPYDRIHGGSYHKTTNKKAIGHFQGIPKFFNHPFVFIDNDKENLVVENIAKVNNSEPIFINNSKDLDSFFDVTSRAHETMFVKLNYYIDENKLHEFMNSLSENGRVLKQDLKILIESEQAEILCSLLVENCYDSNAERLYKNITVMDDFLFEDELGKIELYDVD